MKILQVCHKPPYPPRDGGSVAMFGLASAFVRLGHDVTVLSVCTSKHNLNEEDRHSLAELMPVHTVFMHTSFLIPALLINFFFSKIPYHAVRLTSAKFSKKLISLLAADTYDVVQLEGGFLAPCIPNIRRYHKGLIVLRAHNAEHEIWQRLASREKNLVKKYYFRMLAKRIRQFEHDVMNRYDLLVPITDRDLETFNQMGNSKPACVCPAGFVVEPSGKTTAESTFLNSSVFFLGSLDWIPNREGLIWFVEEVFPGLVRRIPGLKLHIAGRNASGMLIKKLSRTGIVFHGEIKDSGDFMRSHGIMVAPCFSGGGMRVKIIEAMARGIPVITTPLGAEGLPVNSGENIIIAGEAEDFLRQTERLLKHPDLCRQIGQNATNLATIRFNNNTLASTLADFFNQHRK